QCINLEISLQSTILCNVYILVMKIWINMGGDKLSSADLIFQIQSFYLRKKEYNIPYSASRGDVLTWWILYNSVHSEENYIQKLALKILAITPYNARFEKLEAMVKLYRYYITNAQKELKYAYVGVSENDFQSSI
ncbi:17103_t:CDS:2, partial [Rhizophagus irregularis]